MVIERLGEGGMKPQLRQLPYPPKPRKKPGKPPKKRRAPYLSDEDLVWDGLSTVTLTALIEVAKADGPIPCPMLWARGDDKRWCACKYEKDHEGSHQPSELLTETHEIVLYEPPPRVVIPS